MATMILFLCYYYYIFIYLYVSIYLSITAIYFIVLKYIAIIIAIYNLMSFKKGDRRKESKSIFIMFVLSNFYLIFLVPSYVPIESCKNSVLYSYSSTALLPPTSIMRFCQIYYTSLLYWSNYTITYFFTIFKSVKKRKASFLFK